MAKGAGVFFFLCQYASVKEALNETHAFLVQMDRKGVKWLIFLPDTIFIRKLFSGYRYYLLGPSQSGIRALVITNYLVKK
jgi:hypothetical protein